MSLYGTRYESRRVCKKNEWEETREWKKLFVLYTTRLERERVRKGSFCIVIFAHMTKFCYIVTHTSHDTQKNENKTQWISLVFLFFFLSIVLITAAVTAAASKELLMKQVFKPQLLVHSLHNHYKALLPLPPRVCLSRYSAHPYNVSVFSLYMHVWKIWNHIKKREQIRFALNFMTWLGFNSLTREFCLHCSSLDACRSMFMVFNEALNLWKLCHCAWMSSVHNFSTIDRS